MKEEQRPITGPDQPGAAGGTGTVVERQEADPDRRDWSALPHPFQLMLTVLAIAIAFFSGVTAYFNYQEAKRNNRLPPLIGVSVSVVTPPHGAETGEFEFVVRNDGRTVARELSLRRGLGVAFREVIARGGGDNDRFDAYMAAQHVWIRQEVLQHVAEVVEHEGWGYGRPALIDSLGPGQQAIVRLRGTITQNAFSTVMENAKAFLVVAGFVEYKTEEPDSKPERKAFCFERHQPFSAPALKELMPVCSNAFNFLF